MSMIPEDCFLRKLPVGISLVQRMKLDGIRIAAEMVELSNNRLIAVALHISREQQMKPSGESMTALQTDAWSIVNHCHTIRKILQSSPEIDTNGIATMQSACKKRERRTNSDFMPCQFISQSTSLMNCR